MPAHHPGADAPRLLDQVRNIIRLRHYSIRTKESYTRWIRYFIRYHNLCHPRDMGGEEIKWCSVMRKPRLFYPGCPVRPG